MTSYSDYQLEIEDLLNHPKKSTSIYENLINRLLNENLTAEEKFFLLIHVSNHLCLVSAVVEYGDQKVIDLVFDSLTNSLDAGIDSECMLELLKMRPDNKTSNLDDGIGDGGNIGMDAAKKTVFMSYINLLSKLVDKGIPAQIICNMLSKRYTNSTSFISSWKDWSFTMILVSKGNDQLKESFIKFIMKLYTTGASLESVYKIIDDCIIGIGRIIDNSSRSTRQTNSWLLASFILNIFTLQTNEINELRSQINDMGVLHDSSSSQLSLLTKNSNELQELREANYFLTQQNETLQTQIKTFIQHTQSHDTYIDGLAKENDVLKNQLEQLSQQVAFLHQGWLAMHTVPYPLYNQSSYMQPPSAPFTQSPFSYYTEESVDNIPHNLFPQPSIPSSIMTENKAKSDENLIQFDSPTNPNQTSYTQRLFYSAPQYQPPAAPPSRPGYGP
ncbi:MAG: hypothetical protein A3F11_00160 [Gammaproteobacteria bacterium RIFCSPHIGHO2_12_FULL_37_14]|nr:MAG: hypothetical protein A3F11_00160 [Gammaproteobacteria bacterium RIFCSPHIGHO2_12_FULL_37_14]